MHDYLFLNSQCRKWNSIICNDIKRYYLGSKCIKQIFKIWHHGSFHMYDIRSIQL